MRYLITGGCGFLGANIAAKILRDGHELLVLDNLSRVGSSHNYDWLKEQGHFTFCQNDIRDRDAVESTIGTFQPDIIFHLAGQVAMTTSLEQPRYDFEVNVLGTLNVLEAMRTRCPNSAILYSSTNKVYGDLENLHYEETDTRYIAIHYPQGIPETFSLDFRSPYGCSKGAADQYILDYARIYGIKGAVFRHSSMYGGRQFTTKDQGWIGWFCQKALQQAAGDPESFTIAGSGKQVRDLLYADDMVDLYLKAAASISTISAQAFNIGGGPHNNLSILELLQFLESELACKLRFSTIAPRESDQKVFIADLSKAKTLLHWQPQMDWPQGIKKMLSWINLREAGYG